MPSLPKKSTNEIFAENKHLKFNSKEEEKEFIKKARNVLCKEFYILRQIPESDMIIQMTFEKRKRSNLCLEHWISRGFDEVTAKQKINEAHNKTIESAKKTNPRLKASGILSDEDRIALNRSKSCFTNSELQRELCMRFNQPQTQKYKDACVRLPDHWLKKGFTYDEALLKISSLQKRDLDFYISKYGEVEGPIKFETINSKKTLTWAKKSKDEIFEHAKKTAPKNGISKEEEKAIFLFLSQNGISSEQCLFGPPKDQFFQNIPGVGFRRYDLAVFEDQTKTKLTHILEYNGFFHIKELCENDEEVFGLGGGNKNETFKNDQIKRLHIKEKFPDVIYCVAWKENLKLRKMQIEYLKI